MFPEIQQPTPTAIAPSGHLVHVRTWQCPTLCKWQSGEVLATRYSAKIFEGYNAASLARLTEQQRYFYELGRHISRFLTVEEGERVANSLLRLFLHRTRQIFSLTLDLNAATRNLKFAETELAVYNRGNYMEHRLQNWQRDVPRPKQQLEKKFRSFS